jgi:chromosome segregation ATPase
MTTREMIKNSIDQVVGNSNQVLNGSKSIIRESIDTLVEADPPSLRRSARPLTAHADLVRVYDDNERKIEEVNAEAQKLMSEAQSLMTTVKPLQARNVEIQNELLGVLDSYEDRTIKLKSLNDVLITTYEKIIARQKRTPVWTDYIERLLREIGEIAGEMRRKEMEELQNTFREWEPEKKKFKFKRESISEGIIDTLGNILSHISGLIQRSWNRIQGLEQQVIQLVNEIGNTVD